MISEKMEHAFNEQINRELHSAYLYTSMAAYLYSENFLGFSNWMSIQAHEEVAHGMAIYKYILDRGGRVHLFQIDEPAKEFASVLDVFESTLAHEQYITSEINKIADYAEEENDKASLSFLKWYIDEQVEEESSVSEIAAQIKLSCDDTAALLMIDRELNSRTYQEPLIN